MDATDFVKVSKQRLLKITFVPDKSFRFVLVQFLLFGILQLRVCAKRQSTKVPRPPVIYITVLCAIYIGLAKRLNKRLNP